MDHHDRTVRRDVRELGASLGDVISERSPSDDLETVETVRTAAIDRLESGMSSLAPPRDAFDGLTVDDEGVVGVRSKRCRTTPTPSSRCSTTFTSSRRSPPTRPRHSARP